MAADEGRLQLPRDIGSGKRGAGDGSRNDAGGRSANPDYRPTVPRILKNGWVEIGADSFIGVRELYRILKVK